MSAENLLGNRRYVGPFLVSAVNAEQISMASTQEANVPASKLPQTETAGVSFVDGQC
jgi:hypothetical protein